LVFAAHPASSGNTWGGDECAHIKKSRLFGGLQVFNERVTCERKVFGIDFGIDVEYDLSSWKSTVENPYRELEKAIEIWSAIFWKKFIFNGISRVLTILKPKRYTKIYS
jgi:hypothetical protein